MNDMPNRLFTDAVVYGQAAEGLPVGVAGSNYRNVGGREFGAGVSIAPTCRFGLRISDIARPARLKPHPNGVRLVFLDGTPFKIRGSVVGPDAVLVVYHSTIEGWTSEECEGHEAVNRPICAARAASGTEAHIAISLAHSSFQDTTPANAEPFGVATKTTKIGNGVIGKLGASAPFFGFKFFGGKLRFSHDAFTSSVKRFGQGRFGCFSTRLARLFYHDFATS